MRFFPEPSGREDRPDWKRVPQEIVQKIESLCGAEIKNGRIVWGGYSPSACFCLTLLDGRKVFAKGSWPGQTAHGAEMLRQEIYLYRNVPLLSKVGAPFIGYVGEKEEDGWHLGLWHFVEGKMPQPWTQEKIKKVFETLARLYAQTSDNLPEHIPTVFETSHIADLYRAKGGWQKIKSNETAQQRFLSLFEKKKEAEDWAKEAVPLLAEAQNKIKDMDCFCALTHHDLRTDNILIDKKGKVHILDWPNACHGPVLMDIVCLIGDIHAQIDFSAQDMFTLFEKESGHSFKKENLHAVMAVLSGYFADNAGRSVPDRLPRLRWIQKQQLFSLLEWAVLEKKIPPYPSPAP